MTKAATYKERVKKILLFQDYLLGSDINPLLQNNAFQMTPSTYYVYENIIGLDKQKFQRKIVNIFLPINFNICFGCSKEPSHWDGSFEYPQHIIGKLNFRYSLLT